MEHTLFLDTVFKHFSLPFIHMTMIVKFIFIFLAQILTSMIILFGATKKIWLYGLFILLCLTIYFFIGSGEHLKIIESDNYLKNYQKTMDLRPKLAALKREEALLLLTIEDNPNDQEALFNIAKIYLLTQEFAKAKLYLQHLYSLRPNPKIRELLDSL